MNINTLNDRRATSSIDETFLNPDRTFPLLLILEDVLKYVPESASSVKELSSPFRFAVEKMNNPLFKIGQIFEKIILREKNDRLQRIRSELRDPQIFLNPVDYIKHAFPITKNFVCHLTSAPLELKKLIDDLMNSSNIEGINQAIELVSVIKDRSIQLDYLIFLTEKITSQIPSAKVKVRFENLARIVEIASAIENLNDRSLYMFNTQVNFISIIPTAVRFQNDREIKQALKSIVHSLFKMGCVSDNKTSMEVRQSNYHALDVAMRLLAEVQDETFKKDKLEAFFPIFNKQIETVVEIANGDQDLYRYACDSLLASVYQSTQMVKSLTVEKASMATSFLRVAGFANVGPKEETKNRFLSLLSSTFAHMRQAFERLSDPYLLKEVNAMENREFPQGIV